MPTAHYKLQTAPTVCQLQTTNCQLLLPLNADLIAREFPAIYLYYTNVNGASLQCKMNQLCTAPCGSAALLSNNFQKIKLRETLRL